jgi:hypothetical protein
MYTFNKNELRTFREICLGSSTVEEVVRSTHLPQPTVYRILASLERKRVVRPRKGGYREPVLMSHYAHSEALRDYLLTACHPLESIADSKLLVLLSISSTPKTLKRISTETRLTVGTTEKYVRALDSVGMTYRKDLGVSMSPSDARTIAFLERFSRGADDSVISDLTDRGVILWNEGLQFIFSTPEGRTIQGAIPTAITAMARFGLDFMPTQSYYHYAYWRPSLRVEDIALHNILVDPFSTRNTSYSLLLLRKTGFAATYLLEEGRNLGMETKASDIARYLRGKGVQDKFFPTRAELNELCRQYHVE